MKNHLLWGVIIPILALGVSNHAFAQYCVHTIEVQIVCSGPGGCNHPFAIDYCGQGCGAIQGSSCSCGYGLCCGNSISECSVSGYCTRCNSRVAIKREVQNSSQEASIGERQKSDARSRRHVALNMIFAPDKCARSYRVIIPGEARTDRGDPGCGS